MKKFIPFLLLGCFLLTCKEDDPCEGKICLNGGTCVDGTCECSQKYEGADCGDQVTPKNIKITNVYVTNYPVAASNGAGWDSGSGPDLTFSIKATSGIVYTSGTFFEDVSNPSLSYKFTPSSPIQISPTIQYTIELYDYDPLDANDLMGTVVFAAYDDEKGFPEDLIISSSNGTVSFRLSLTYTF